MKTCGIIILAAGNSSRLGKPKQLLRFREKSLLQHVLDEALAVEAAKCVLVLGSEAEEMETQINAGKAIVCHNAQWAAGMSGSIHLGLQKLLELQLDVDCCIIAVCDQPFITTQLFRNLYEVAKENKVSIVASSYADTAGTPALFDKSQFDALLKLKGREGAKKLLKLAHEDLLLVPFERGEIDIDTPEDYLNLQAGL
jgi:molybdenum cofactor cytidylyltransferase